MNQRYFSIIEDYLERRRLNPDTWVETCRSERDFKKALGYAATARDHNGKKHSHQFRLPNDTLDMFKDELQSNMDGIKKSKNFDELLAKVTDLKIYGIGPVCIYDTAERIGVRLNLHPDKIYLHAGTRVGAENLLGKIKGNIIRKSDLPEPFRSSDLTPAELENILCIYKNELGQNKRKNKRINRCLPVSRTSFSYC